MKKHLSALLCLILSCIAVLLTSCSGNSQAMNYLNKDFKPSETYTSSKEISSVSGNIQKNENGIFLFQDRTSKNTKYYIYDIKNDTVLFEYTATKDDKTYIDVEIIENNGDVAYIVIYKNNNSLGQIKKAELYQDSTLIDYFEGNDKMYYNNDVIVFGSDAYRFVKSKLEHAFYIPEYMKIPEEVSVASKDYNFIYNEDNTVSIFDKNYNLVTIYNPPQADYNLIYTLDNGDLFCSSTILLPDDAAEYTVYDYAAKLGINSENSNKIKVDIKQEIYHVSKDESSSVDANYLIGALLPKFLYTEEDIIFNDKAANIVVARKINNKMISDETEILAVNNKFKIKAEFGSIFKNHSAKLISNKRWMLTDENNYFRIIDSNAKSIADFQATSKIIANEKYIISSSCIYDFEMKELFDFSGEGYTYCGKTNKSIILSKGSGLNVEYYIYRDSVIKISGDSVSNTLSEISDSYFIIKSIGDNGYQEQYFNDIGENIQTLKSVKTGAQIYEYDGCALLAHVNANGNTIYYRFGQ